MGMDQYLLIPFLMGWTSINPSYFDVHQGYKVLTHCQIDGCFFPGRWMSKMIALEDFSYLEEGDVEGLIGREFVQNDTTAFCDFGSQTFWIMCSHMFLFDPFFCWLQVKWPWQAAFKSNPLVHCDFRLLPFLALLLLRILSYISMDQKCTILGPIE